MSLEFHERVSRIVADALERTPGAREAFVRAACAEDERLSREVHSLLAHAEGWDFEPLKLAARLPHTANAPARLAEPARLVEPAPGLPRRCGPYRVLALLGRGGSGVVYEAEQEQPRRRVALKALSFGPAASERLEREANILAALDHPGIAKLYSVGWADPEAHSGPYLAMELVRGLPLDAWANAHGLDQRGRIGLVIQVCEALQHAHQRGIAHLDLKPDNILVDGAGRARVLDFGIARAMESDLRIATLRLDEEHVLGTLPFMSPEQASGRSDALGASSDLYSIGVLLYLLLAQRLPHELRDSGAHEALRIVREETPSPIRRAGRRIPRDLCRIVHMALEQEPRRRYASCLEFAGDLRRYLAGQPVRARRPSLWYRSRRFLGRHRMLASVVSALLVALSVALGASLHAWTRAREVLRLADLDRLRVLRSEADALWPAVPERCLELEAWLESAHELEGRLERHRAALAAMRADALALVRESPDGPDGPDAADGELHYRFAQREQQWWHDNLESLVAQLEDLLAESPRPGLRARMRERLAFASTIQERSIQERREEWQAAIRSIADPRECPRYAGLTIEPQLGLIPLGRNERSGLWEFAHLASGPPAPFEARAGGRVDARSGLVLVLIPAGEVLLGAQSEDALGPHFDPAAESWEGYPTRIELWPYFLSKYEMTVEQWERCTGESPAFYTAPYSDFESRPTRAHPIENVSWNRCQQECLRLGLDLPSEARWELAARAGSSTPWFSGGEPQSLIGFANLSDSSSLGVRSGLWPREEWLQDGHVIHASVGSFGPNAYGLFDVLGNVAEWTKDERPIYDCDPRTDAGDGLYLGRRDRRVARGGSFSKLALDARCSARFSAAPTSRSDDIGLRPCRALDGYWPGRGGG